MAEFESCDLENGVWAYSDGGDLFMWVHRVSEMPKFQLIRITLCSGMDLDSLRIAVTSIGVPGNNKTPIMAAATTPWPETAYETDHAAAGLWVIAENGHLVMKVKRSTPHGTKSELKIAIRTPEALRHLVDATSNLRIGKYP